MTQVTALPSYKENLEELIGELANTLPQEKVVGFNNDAALLAKAFPSPLKLKEGESRLFVFYCAINTMIRN